MYTIHESDQLKGIQKLSTIGKQNGRLREQVLRMALLSAVGLSYSAWVGEGYTSFPTLRDFQVWRGKSIELCIRVEGTPKGVIYPASWSELESLAWKSVSVVHPHAGYA